MDQLDFALETIDGGTFEDLTMAFLRAEGYDVHESGRPGPDGGWDARVKLGTRTGVAHASSEKQWKSKLRTDAESVADLEQKQDKDYDLFVFVTSQNVKGTQELDMEEEIAEDYEWTLKLYHRKNIIGEIRQNSPEIADEFLDIDVGTDHDLLRRIEDRRDKFVEQIRNREGNASSLLQGPTVALHVIPYGVFSQNATHSSTKIPDPAVIGGLMRYEAKARGKSKIAVGRGQGPNGEILSYSVMENDGMYESANQEMIGVNPETGEAWLSGYIRRGQAGLDASVIIAIQATLNGLREMGFSGSALASVSLIDAASVKLSTPKSYDRMLYEPPTLGSDTYSTMLYSIPIGKSEIIEDLEPMLSEVWREFGHEEGTVNIENGVWARSSVSINRETLLEEGDR